VGNIKKGRCLGKEGQGSKRFFAGEGLNVVQTAPIILGRTGKNPDKRTRKGKEKIKKWPQKTGPC